MSTTTEKTHTFLGMTIVGDLSYNRERKPQRPESELAPYFQAVFAGGVITGVKWTQYTPYFNDGDPCVFSANEYSLMIKIANRQVSEDEIEKLEAEAETGDESDFSEGWIETETYSDDSPMATLIGREVWAPGENRWRGDKPTYQGPRPELAQAVFALRGALAGGEFDDALQRLFGDHARVMVPASGDIQIESYEHD